MTVHRDMRVAAYMSARNQKLKGWRKESQRKKVTINWDLLAGLSLKIKRKNNSNTLKQQASMGRHHWEAPYISTWTNHQFNLLMLCIHPCYNNLFLINQVFQDREMILIFSKCQSKNIIQQWTNSKLWVCSVENVQAVTQNLNSTINITLTDTLFLRA